MTKVEELVEWVADNIEQLPSDSMEIAKIILSHPDLALIDREDEAYSAAIMTGVVTPLAKAIKELK